MTDCNVAIVFSNASFSVGDSVLCAKNSDANKSPVPVKFTPQPCFGMDIVYRSGAEDESVHESETINDDCKLMIEIRLHTLTMA